MIVVSAAMMAALLLPDAEPEAALRMRQASPPEIHDAASPRVVPSLPPSIQGVDFPRAADWKSVRNPFRLYSLEAPETEGSSAEYHVMVRGISDRRDLLSWTPPETGRNRQNPLLALQIERFERQQPTQKPFLLDLTERLNAISTTIMRHGPITEMQTKFGTMQIADVLLGLPEGTRGCLLLRRVDTSGLVIAGWACSAQDRPLSRVTLACLIDRLDLTSAGEDSGLKRLFAQAERQRDRCISARQSGRRLTWLDHEAPIPALKLR